MSHALAVLHLQRFFFYVSLQSEFTTERNCTEFASPKGGILSLWSLLESGNKSNIAPELYYTLGTIHTGGPGGRPRAHTHTIKHTTQTRKDSASPRYGLLPRLHLRAIPEERDRCLVLNQV